LRLLFGARSEERFDGIDEALQKADIRFDGIDEAFKQTEERFDGIDDAFKRTDGKLDSLERGQQEIKDLMKHHTTLLTENMTSMRRDLGRRVTDTEADVNLLFKEVEEVKRSINKLEKK
jgi:predicted  nucleic acid-binding Zn-ribbon protein